MVRGQTDANDFETDMAAPLTRSPLRSGQAFHEPMVFRFRRRRRTRSDDIASRQLIPLEIFQSHWQLLFIREREAMLEHSGAKPFALEVRKQVELTKSGRGRRASCRATLWTKRCVSLICRPTFSFMSCRKANRRSAIRLRQNARRSDRTLWNIGGGTRHFRCKCTRSVLARSHFSGSCGVMGTLLEPHIR